MSNVKLHQNNEHKVYIMIFNFRIVSDEVDNFKREIQIDSTATFLDLKKVICNSVGFDAMQMSSFFLCDRNWEKEKEITYEDMGVDADQEVWLMDESVLSDFIEDEGQKLLYVFDYLTDRMFFIEMTQLVPGRSLKDPLCTLSLGIAPPETIDIEEFEAKVEAKRSSNVMSDLDEDFYGEDGYNEDEFDTQGFDEMTFDD